MMHRIAILLVPALLVSSANAQQISGSAGAGPTKAGTGYTSFTTTQGTATATDLASGIMISDTDQGVDAIRALCKASPSPPYTITGKFSLTAKYGADGDSWGGFAWRNAGNGHIQAYGILNRTDERVPSVFSIDFSDYLTYGGSSEASMDTWQPTMWLSIQDDGTNAKLGYSMDGTGFNQLFSIAKASGYLGATGYNQVCIFVSAHGSDAKLLVQSYSETSP